MFYVDADNNLESSLLSDIQEIKNSFIENKGITALLLVDRCYKTYYPYSNNSKVLDGNFSEARLYKLGKYSYERLADPDFLGISDQGAGRELNMADAHVLKNFVKYAKKKHQAEHYALIISNHGLGVRGGESLATEISRGVCLDESHPGDLLFTAEISDILTSEESVDLLGFDACYMGNVENAYQYRPTENAFSADYYIGSAASEYVTGWDYQLIFNRIFAEYQDRVEALTPVNVGNIIIDEVKRANKRISTQTLGFYNLQKAQNLKNNIDILAVLLQDYYVEIEDKFFKSGLKNLIYYFKTARDGSSGKSGWLSTPFFDLANMVLSIKNLNLSSEINNQCLKLEKIVDEFVISSYGNRTYSSFQAGINGVGIFLPNGLFSSSCELYSADFPNDWSHLWWYNSLNLRGNEYRIDDNFTNLGYGNLAWCKNNANENNNQVENWFELLDYWFDTEDGFGGFNLYKY